MVENGRPIALYSGGSLMVGAVGRTDLCGSELAVPLAHKMFGALRRFEFVHNQKTSGNLALGCLRLEALLAEGDGRMADGLVE